MQPAPRQPDLNVLFEYSSDVIYLTSAETRIDYVSPSVERVLGFAPDDVLGRLGTEFIHPDDLERAFSVLADVLAEPDGVARVTLRVETKAGPWRWVEIIARNLMANPAIGALMLNLRDVADRVALEQQLTARNAQLEDAERLGRTGSWEYDVTNDLMHPSPQLLDLFDLEGPAGPMPMEEWLRAFSEHERVEARAKWDIVIEQARRGMTEVVFEAAGKLHSGRDFVHGLRAEPVEIDGKLILRGVSHDITDRRKLEAELEERAASLGRLMSNLPGIAYRALNDRAWPFQFASEGCHDLVGFGADEFMSRAVDWGDRIVPEDRHRVWDATQEALAEKRRFSYEYRVRRANDEIAWVEEHGVGVYDKDGRTVALEGLITDVTERVKHQSRLERLLRAVRTYNARLESSNRDWADFAHTAAHDLREPLRKVQLFADRLLESLAPHMTEQATADAARIMASLERMRHLIRDLLDYSSVASRGGNWEQVDLATIAREAAADLEAQREQVGGTIEIAEMPTIDADRTQMGQLLRNLISNALKFHRDGAPPIVRVNASLVKLPGAPPETASHVHISVEDNGIGFDQQHLDRIFVMFKRLHPQNRYEGTGIGLAICRRIVERHAGSITAQSLAGEGATFQVTLPTRQTGEDDSQVVDAMACCAAASIGDISLLQLMAEQGADLDAPDYDGRTPLHLAVANGHLSVVRYLLSCGVQRDLPDRWGHTPLAEAEQRGATELVALLRESR